MFAFDAKRQRLKTVKFIPIGYKSNMIKIE